MLRYSRRVGCWWIALLAALSAVGANADEYPSRPIKFINGSAPGSVLDVVTRQIGERLAAGLGQPVTVEARPTAGGVAALEALKASAPDGYTLSMVHIAQMSAAPALFPHLPYDPQKDFSPVGIVFRGPQMLVVNADVEATTLPELIALAKAYPGSLRYATPGVGTPNHVLMEQLKAATETDFVHVPYRGFAATLAVLKGEVELLLEGGTPLAPYLKSGKLRAIAVGGSRRLPGFPDLPTFEELGIRGMDDVWVGIVAPAGTPRRVIERLNAELERVMREPEFRANYEALGRIVKVSSPEEMRAAIREETPRWTRVIREAGIFAN